MIKLLNACVQPFLNDPDRRGQQKAKILEEVKYDLYWALIHQIIQDFEVLYTNAFGAMEPNQKRIAKDKHELALNNLKGRPGRGTKDAS